MKSDVIKAHILSWLRFKKGCALLATEVQVNKSAADVLAVIDNKFFEVEVKTSIADFKRDFEKVSFNIRTGGKRKAVAKHDHLQDSDSVTRYKPNYFCFAVPDTLAEKAASIMEEKGVTGYGLIAVYESGDIKSVKRASDLRKDARVYQNVQHAILLRMGSQMVSQAREAAGLPKQYLKR